MAENSSTWCKFHKGRKGLWPMGSNADRRRSQTLMAVKRHQVQARRSNANDNLMSLKLTLRTKNYLANNKKKLFLHTR